MTPFQIMRMINPTTGGGGSITFVGSGVAAGTSDVTYAFSSLLNEAGAAPTILEGDYVFVGVCRAVTGVDLSGAGYTQVGTELTATDTAITKATLWYKKMGATPDTDVLINCNNMMSAEIVVVRGANATTVLDVAVATITGTNTAVPNVPTITPVTAGAAVIGFGMGSINSTANTALTIPSGADSQTNRFRQGGQNNIAATARVCSAVAMKLANGAVAYDMATFGGGVTTNTGSWAAFAVAIRPA